MIQTEPTPNPESLKFLSEHIISAIGTEEFQKVGDLITKTIKGLSENPNDNSKIESEVKAEVIELCSKFPIYKNLRK